ncbi:MAG: RIP metalloprotease RseP [Proteobacteria bacterium]|nr:RIP metalloprotease RseP [Pseudomonadota bacterium]
MAFLQTIASFIVALGILVTIHEYGHYWVARKVGVKILRFSVGFGKPLWSMKKGDDETEFVIAAVPLGGYVKMLDDREGEVPAELRHRSFNAQSLGARVAIVLAGPVANLLFAVFVYWAMYLVGVSGPRPVVGEIVENSIASRAGLKAGEEIKGVNGDVAPTWDNVFRSSITAILDSGSIELQVDDKDGLQRDVVLNLESISIDDLSRGDFFEKVGFKPFRPIIEPRIGRVVAGESAALAGLLAGDLIVSADGQLIGDWIEWVEFIRSMPGRRIDVSLMRNGQQINLWLIPQTVSADGESIGRIGAEVDATGIESVPMGIERYGLLEAMPRAVARAGEAISTTLKFIRKMIIGEASVDNLSGPISIAQFAGQSAKLGLSRFLDFLGLVSISLGVLNLLPIPLLDGGHLMYYLLEFVLRRPVPESVQVVGQQVGFMLLLGLMGLAVYNDIMRMM